MKFIKREYTKRERLFLIAGTLCVLLVVFKLLFAPLWEKRQSLGEYVAMKEELLERTKEVISRKSEMEARRDHLGVMLAKYEASLLAGKTANLASAELQSRIERIGRQSGVRIKRINTLKAESMGEYTKVWVEVTFHGDIRSLLNLLYDVENSAKALIVTQMDVRLQNNAGQQRLKVVMRVAGGSVVEERDVPASATEAKEVHENVGETGSLS